MTAERPPSLLTAWKLAGTIAIAGVVFVCRETLRILDERTGQMLDWKAVGDRAGAPKIGSSVYR